MPTALFGLGQIVRHREAAFRGVVVDVDPVFLGGGVETGQVPRDQPFYRILAVGEDGGFLAYAAQDTLEHDPDTGSLSPMDQRNLFTVDAQGRYAPKSHAIH
jgi:heat shock protein HspQ